MEKPGVQRAAVIPIKDVKWGERPLALVVLHAEQAGKIGEDDIRLHVASYVERGLVSKIAIPESVTFVAELPLTSVGKRQEEAAGKLRLVRWWRSGGLGRGRRARTSFRLRLPLRVQLLGDRSKRDAFLAANQPPSEPGRNIRPCRARLQSGRLVGHRRHAGATARDMGAVPAGRPGRRVVSARTGGPLLTPSRVSMTPETAVRVDLHV